MSRLIVMTASDYSDGSIEREILKSVDAELKIVACKTETDVIQAARGAEGILVTYTPIREAALKALKDLKIIVRCGIGVDNLDLAAAKDNGVRICNVPDYCLDEVADHAFSMLLALERQLFVQVMDIKKGEFNGIAPIKSIRGLHDSILGIVGFGQIGRKLAARAQAFGIKVMAYDPFVNDADASKLGISMKSMDDLLKESDFVSLHPPLTPENFHIIDDKSLKLMKPSAYLINTSRGPLIDRKALAQALRHKIIAGAGLDVVEDDLEGTREFTQMDNVIITPHTAWYSKHSFNELRKKSAEELVRFFRGEKLAHPLN